jgi:carbonic anhydrase
MHLSRRSALQALGVAAGVVTTTAAQHRISEAAAAAPDTPLRQELEACIPDGDPLEALLQRNRIFSKAWQQSRQASDPLERMQIKQAIFDASCHINPHALAQGQRPWAALLSCADSRVAPEWMFGLGSGELFQVRVAGNSAFNDGIASLEYAVAVLNTPLILVIGHSGCGAVEAAMGSQPLTPLLEELVQPIRQSLIPGDELTKAIQGNARYAARQLTQRSSTLADAQAKGSVRIQPVFFDIGSALVTPV